LANLDHFIFNDVKHCILYMHIYKNLYLYAKMTFP
jgi:hypothetical protein